MSARIALFDGTTYDITEEQADQVCQAMVLDDKFIKLKGSMIAISAIQHFDHIDYTPEQADQPKLAAPKATPWKREQFAELQKRHATLKGVSKTEYPAWIETEAEFRAVMAGKKPWPKYDGREEVHEAKRQSGGG